MPNPVEGRKAKFLPGDIVADVLAAVVPRSVAVLILEQLREGRLPIRLPCALLCAVERAEGVALRDRPARAGREHEVPRTLERASIKVRLEHERGRPGQGYDVARLSSVLRGFRSPARLTWN